MKRLIIVAALLIAPCRAVKVTLADAAAVTTICVNALEIKTTVGKIRHVARKAKVVVVHTTRKLFRKATK